MALIASLPHVLFDVLLAVRALRARRSSSDGEGRYKKCDNSLAMKSHYKGRAIFAAISVSWSGRLSPLFYDQATV